MHTKERTFQCPSCPRAFATSWQAKSHIKNNHGQKKSYKCQKCTRSGFKTPQALAGHVKSFHMTKVKKSSNASGGPTPQICEHCSQVLVKNHQCHEKDTSITCSICQKQMSTKSYRAHLQYHRHSIYIRTASS